METINTVTINKEVMVNASKETCFKVFTGQIDKWWPRSHHVGKYPMVESVLEEKQGGRWYSRHEDGSEVNIGRVLQWDPFNRVMLAWQINGDFQYDPDLVTEVVVNFFEEADDRTRVTLEHRDLQKLAGGSKAIDSMDEGWGMILNLYKEIANEVTA